MNFDHDYFETFISDDIAAERVRQDELRNAGKFPNSMPDLVLAGRHSDALTVLAEEFGEVSEIVCCAIDNPAGVDRAHLREELVQVAACCVGWIEGLDALAEARDPVTGTPDWMLPPCGAD